ncbi:MAG: hypothetical protein OEZ39_04805 [Gammaproteobacteria bacterium]|nr:hypothetical protein [Gammaproteobacteria bacterium]MDH5651178.1 hypothetical protein [Gammaproteobacteria bacterium]
MDNLDTTISHWVGKVPNQQWIKEDDNLESIGSTLPDTIADSRPLSEVHSLDLSLFVVFEEAALRVSGALTRSAPTLDTMNFSAQQTLDEARHHEIFLRRLEESRSYQGKAGTGINEAILIPPLRNFLDRCYEIVDRGEFVEGLSLMNLVFEGMAYPLYAYEQRYWEPVDPYLSSLVRSAFADEARHVTYGAQLVSELLKGDTKRKARVNKLCKDASQLMDEVFSYYVRKFVKLFDAVARQHKGLFADAEFAPGRKIFDTPYEEQIKTIHASIEKQHNQLITRAGIA